MKGIAAAILAALGLTVADTQDFADSRRNEILSLTEKNLTAVHCKA